ncbi:hypothetical protein BGZ80_003284, partial [Entomortierella chlamydospora]
PQEYIQFRAVSRDQSTILIHEWSRWMADLKKSPHGGVQRAAVAALPLTQKNLDDYYRLRFFAKRELDTLESSSQQLKAADQQYTSHLNQKGQSDAVPALASSSTSHDLEPAIETTNPRAGNGRLDSHVDNAWVINNVEVGRGLMNFRDDVVRENGAMTKPYEKL